MSLIPLKTGLAALALGLVLTASASQVLPKNAGFMSAPRARRPFKSAMPGQANIWNMFGATLKFRCIGSAWLSITKWNSRSEFPFAAQPRR